MSLPGCRRQAGIAAIPASRAGRRLSTSAPSACLGLFTRTQWQPRPYACATWPPALARHFASLPARIPGAGLCCLAAGSGPTTSLEGSSCASYLQAGASRNGSRAPTRAQWSADGWTRCEVAQDALEPHMRGSSRTARAGQQCMLGSRRS